MTMSGMTFSSRLVDVPTALSTQGNVTVIGIVVDVFRGVWKSQGSSSCITFTIKDSDLGNGHTWDGLKVKYFKDNDSQLPPVKEGDVVLLRNIWVRNFKGKPLGVAAQDKTIPWAIFRHDSDPQSSAAPMCGPTPFEPSHHEKRRASYLLDLGSNVRRFRNPASLHTSPPQSSTVQTSVPKPKSHPYGEFTLIKDARDETYVGLLGEVIKVYTSSSDKAVLFITDYTTNKGLPDYTSDDDNGREGDDYNYLRSNRRKWPGPSGQMSLSVTAWEPHASFVRQHVKEGAIVKLINVHIRQNNVKQNTLEAVIHTGHQNIHGIKVRLVDAHNYDHAKDLLRRKKEYWNRNPSKRPAEEENESTRAYKKANKKQRQKSETKEQNQTVLEVRERQKPNPNIEAAYQSFHDRTIEEIMDNESHNNLSPDNVEYRFPFQNLCYRAIVRVVDFFPPLLEDFAVPEDQDDSSASESDSDSGERFRRWEWRFCLLVESASPPAAGQATERMKLYVPGADAVHLTGLDATDLRKDPQTLAHLREKLFILWGDLEEQKRKAAEQHSQSLQKLGSLSSRPFACCIKEYGVRCSHDSDSKCSSGSNESSCSRDGCFGWERRFAMFLTRIRD